MKVIITGIKGFLGSNLAKSLSSNYEIKGIGRKKGSFNSIEVFSSKSKNYINFVPNVVIHAHAAVASGQTFLSINDLFDTNVLVTKEIVSNLPDAFHIFISSTAVYQNCTKKINEHSFISPLSDYASSKYWGEKITLSANKSTVIRFPSLYGCGMKENTLIPNYINQALKQNMISVWGNGNRLQNYLHIHDAIRYINAIIENKEITLHKTLLGTYPREYSNLEIAQIIQQKTKCNISFINEDNSSSVRYDSIFTQGLLTCSPIKKIDTEINNFIEWKKQ